MLTAIKRRLDLRNPIVVAVVGTAVIAGAIGLTLSFGQLSIISKATYHGSFADASGLLQGDVVRIAGINVGEVSAVELKGAHVEVAFTVNRANKLGRDTKLHIKVLSVLGQVFLDVEPAGDGQISGRDMIPTSRTTTPYTLLEVLGTLSTQTQQVDLGQLATALNALSDSLRNAPPATAQLLDGLSRLSQTLASRSQQLSTMLSSTEGVTSTLASRQGQLVALLGDADLVLQAIEARRAVIHQLLVDVNTLAVQINAVIGKDAALLKPLLANLQGISDVLAKNQASLDQSAQDIAPFSREVANASGSGSWVDIIVPTALMPDNILVQCAKPGATQGNNGCTP